MVLMGYIASARSPSTGGIAVYHEAHAPLSKISLLLSGGMRAPPPPPPPPPPPVRAYNEALERFLEVHMMNLAGLQEALGAGGARGFGADSE